MNPDYAFLIFNYLASLKENNYLVTLLSVSTKLKYSLLRHNQVQSILKIYGLYGERDGSSLNSKLQSESRETFRRVILY